VSLWRGFPSSDKTTEKSSEGSSERKLVRAIRKGAYGGKPSSAQYLPGETNGEWERGPVCSPHGGIIGVCCRVAGKV
jgi:hypothetical protein